VCAVELIWNFQVRSGKSNPFGSNVVHMRKDCGDGADFAGWLSGSGGRVELFDEKLVHAFIGGKNLHGGFAELRLRWRRVGFHAEMKREIQIHFRADQKSIGRTKSGNDSLPGVYVDIVERDTRFYTYRELRQCRQRSNDCG